MAVGVTRVGATATKTILDDFRARQAGSAPVAATPARRRAATDAGRRMSRQAFVEPTAGVPIRSPLTGWPSEVFPGIRITIWAGIDCR
jgi:hypothetical protein